MLATAQAVDAYRRQHVQGASPVEIVVLLYDKAIAQLRQAAAAMQAGQAMEKGRALGVAVDIIAELQAVLDGDRGGIIAAKLDALYTYMLTQLTQANLTNDMRKTEEVLHLLEELRESWRTLARPVAAGR
jgi:flagellar protein FliS